MKRWAKYALLLAVVFIGSTILWWQMGIDKSFIDINGHRYHVAATLTTDNERTKGLSGTKQLDPDSVFVFVYPEDGNWGIWMKDMKYDIDIIWVNKGGEVIYLVKDAKPSSYPKTIYEPGSDNTRYVIEMASGNIERAGIHKGSKVALPRGL